MFGWEYLQATRGCLKQMSQPAGELKKRWAVTHLTLKLYTTEMEEFTERVFCTRS